MTSTPYEATASGHPAAGGSWVLASLLVLVVDNTVLNLAIPALMRDLSATPADVQWIIDAYILVVRRPAADRGQPLRPATAGAGRC